MIYYDSIIYYKTNKNNFSIARIAERRVSLSQVLIRVMGGVAKVLFQIDHRAVQMMDVIRQVKAISVPVRGGHMIPHYLELIQQQTEIALEHGLGSDRSAISTSG